MWQHPTIRTGPTLVLTTRKHSSAPFWVMGGDMCTCSDRSVHPATSFLYISPSFPSGGYMPSVRPKRFLSSAKQDAGA